MRLLNDLFVLNAISDNFAVSLCPLVIRSQKSNKTILLLQISLRYLVHTRALRVGSEQHRPRREITHPGEKINLAHRNRKHADKFLCALTSHPASQTSDKVICLADTYGLLQQCDTAILQHNIHLAHCPYTESL